MSLGGEGPRLFLSSRGLVRKGPSEGRHQSLNVHRASHEEGEAKGPKVPQRLANCEARKGRGVREIDVLMPQKRGSLPLFLHSGSSLELEGGRVCQATSLQRICQDATFEELSSAKLFNLVLGARKHPRISLPTRLISQTKKSPKERCCRGCLILDQFVDSFNATPPTCPIGCRERNSPPKSIPYLIIYHIKVSAFCNRIRAFWSCRLESDIGNRKNTNFLFQKELGNTFSSPLGKKGL